MQILAKEHSLPEVRSYWSVGSDAVEISGILFLTVEAEHRTPKFDDTATFTTSGHRPRRSRAARHACRLRRTDAAIAG
jgi:hypothetical protein